MGVEAAGNTTILFKLKLGKMVTTIATIGFNCGAQELYFHRVGRRGPGQVPPSVASLPSGYERSDLPCRQ